MDSSLGGRGFVDPPRGLGLNIRTMNPDLVRNYLTGLQDRLCAILEEVDGKARFITDEWKRAEGGGGRIRVIAGGAVIE